MKPKNVKFALKSLYFKINLLYLYSLLDYEKIKIPSFYIANMRITRNRVSLCNLVGIFLWKKFGKTLLDMKTNIK